MSRFFLTRRLLPALVLLGAPALAQAQIPADALPGTTTASSSVVVIPEHFGTHGQRIFGGTTGFNLEYDYLPSNGNAGRLNVWGVNLAPTFGVFLNDAVFVRLNLGLGYVVQANSLKGLTTGYTVSLAAAPGVGVNIPMGRNLSFAPFVFGGYQWTRQQPVNTSSLSADAAMTHSLIVGVEAPLVIELAKHLSFSMGPVFEQQVINRNNANVDSPKLTTVRIAGGLLGWY
jgi:hypothetical protein